jgi:hypothetical protein
VSEQVALGAGVATIVCGLAVACAPAVPVLGSISQGATIIAAGTSIAIAVDTCTGGQKGSCASAIFDSAMTTAAGGAGGKAGGAGGRGASAAPRAIGPAGDAGAMGLARMDRFRNLADTGFDVAGEHYRLNPHVINSLRKSGRRHIDPESLIRSLDSMPGAGTPGSRVFTDPRTGTRWFVNDANEVVGVWPSGFKG